MRIVAIVILTIAVAGCATRPQGQTIKATLKKAEDSIAVSPTSDVTIVSVTSKSGIGGAKLIRIGESWPSSITVRLRLNNLESFGMSNGYIRFNTSVRSPGTMPYWRNRKNEKQPDQPEGTLEVVIRRTGEWFEINTPQAMMDGNPIEIDFGWINEFRR